MSSPISSIETLKVLGVKWINAFGVALTATSSPGSTILSKALSDSDIAFARYIILYGSITLYNPGTSAVNETIQLFINSSYININEVTVPPNSYVLVPLQYVLPWSSLILSNATVTVGLAGYGGSLTVPYAYLLMLNVG